MFKLTPEIYTVKDVCRVLKVTPRSIQLSIQRKGEYRGVKVKRSKGMILLTENQYNRMIA